ncbi:hypothetical protein [Cohnella sp. GCM10012308]
MFKGNGHGSNAAKNAKKPYLIGTVRIPAPRRSDGRNVGQFLPGNQSR